MQPDSPAITHDKSVSTNYRRETNHENRDFAEKMTRVHINKTKLMATEVEANFTLLS